MDQGGHRGRIAAARRRAAAVLAALLAAGGVAYAQEAPAERRTISVVGRGEVSAAPDLAAVSVAVETTARTAGQATAANAEKSTRVVQAIRRLLGEDDSLSTTRYDLQPRYAPRKPGGQAPPEITGYVARNEVRAEIHGLDDVGEILDAAMQAGANRASNLSFLIENRDPHIRAALARAGAEARAQAESIAAALGVRLGDVISASTTSTPSPVGSTRRFAAMQAEVAPTPIEPGEVKISAQLYVTYEIH